MIVGWRGWLVRSGLQDWPELVDLPFQLGERPGVSKDVIHHRAFLVVGELLGEATACVSLKLCAAAFCQLGARGGPSDKAGDFDLFWSGDKNSAIEAAVPTVLICRLASVIRFKDQSGFDNHYSVRIAPEDWVGKLGLTSDDCGMDDRVQLFDAAIGKSNLGERTAIQLPVRQNDRVAEALDDRRINGLPRLHELAADGVGLQSVGSVRSEEPRGGRFAAAQAAGKADAQHRVTFSP
jgi:hypothetical protein